MIITEIKGICIIRINKIFTIQPIRRIALEEKPQLKYQTTNTTTSQFDCLREVYRSIKAHDLSHIL